MLLLLPDCYFEADPKITQNKSHPELLLTHLLGPCGLHKQGAVARTCTFEAWCQVAVQQFCIRTACCGRMERMKAAWLLLGLLIAVSNSRVKARGFAAGALG